MIGRIPRRLMDDFSRTQTRLDRTVKKIADTAIHLAVEHGFEVLVGDKAQDVPIMVDGNSFSFIARPRGKEKSVGLLIVNRNGILRYEPKDEALEGFKKEMQKELDEDGGVEVLYG
jgi:hypothetical protein